MIRATDRRHLALLGTSSLIMLAAACGPGTASPGRGKDGGPENPDASTSDDGLLSDQVSGVPASDTLVPLADPACLAGTDYPWTADMCNAEFQMNPYDWRVIEESASRLWHQEYHPLEFDILTGGLSWPAPVLPHRGFEGYNVKYGPWVFYSALTLGSPCTSDSDCRPIAVRMSASRLLHVDELHPLYETREQMAMIRCLDAGPHMSTVCAIPCETDDHCADFVDGKRTLGHRAPTVNAGGACVFGLDHGPCVNDLSTTLRCTRHAVRHHRIGPCRRTHASYGACAGNLRCLLEGQQPYCDAPEPSAHGCQGRTLPPPPPAPCGEPITAADGYFDDLGPCGEWPSAHTLCDAGGQPCSQGQLCVPLYLGRRCLDVTQAYFASMPKGGCWPHAPSSAQAGGDWAALPGTLPNAHTATDALEAYDFHLDWQAARGIPCRDDADCKIPITSPFGKTVWLQGATRCAEETPGQGGVCLKPCDIPTHGLCHQGTACAQGPGGWRWCMPDDGVLPAHCSPLAVQLWQELGAGQHPCRRTNPLGSCAGKAVCLTIGAPPSCDAPAPAPEVCGDGVDQDCDGTTDEGCGS